MGKGPFHYVNVFQLSSLGQVVITLQCGLFIHSLGKQKLRKIPEMYTNPFAACDSVYKNLNLMGVIKKICNHFTYLI